eukprot:scaffold7275_cov233-Chaetoceros_neogracile.AAC.1
MIPKSKEDESILKTALAFVVLRRRVKASCSDSSAKDHGNNDILNDLASSSGHNNNTNIADTSTAEDQNPPVKGDQGSCIAPAVSLAQASNSSAAIVTTQSQCSSQSFTSAIHNHNKNSYSTTGPNNNEAAQRGKRKRQAVRQNPNLELPLSNLERNHNRDHGPLPFLRNTCFLQNPALTSISSKEEHIRAMFRIALSTALPLYDPYILSSLHSGHRRQHQHRPLLSSPIYDCQTASWTLQQMKQFVKEKSHSRAKDGTGEHQVESTSENSSSSSIQSYAVLDGIVSHLASNLNSLLAKHEESDHRDKSDRQNPMSKGVIYNLFLCPLVDNIFGPSSSHGNADANANNNEDAQRKDLQSVMGMFTVVHRLIFQNNVSTSSHLVQDVVKGICHTLKWLYYGEGKDSNFPSSSRKYAIQMQDIVVVNCLILLEEVISLRLSRVMRMEVVTVLNEFGEYVEQEVIDSCRISEAAGEILNLVNGIMGAGNSDDDGSCSEESLILPVPLQDMAGFHVRHAERAGRARCKGMHLGATDNMGTEDGRGLGAGSKMMLRLSLFDLVRKLTSHHLG